MFSIIDKDLGTPAPRKPRNVGSPTTVGEPAAALVTLTIDGREISVPEGTSVLRAAALADINIPKLCATDTL
jgi:formate dehydrogenase major subunit